MAIEQSPIKNSNKALHRTPHKVRRPVNADVQHHRRKTVMKIAYAFCIALATLIAIALGDDITTVTGKSFIDARVSRTRCAWNKYFAQERSCADSF
jgi:hypothetical protein